jgi:hypothetical protein
MKLFKPKPNFTLGNIAAFVGNRKEKGKKTSHVLFYRMYKDKNEKVAFSHELTVDDLPALRALADDIYQALKRNV